MGNMGEWATPFKHRITRSPNLTIREPKLKLPLLPILIALNIVLVVILLCARKRLNKEHAAFSGKSRDELIAIAEANPLHHGDAVIEELKKRGEDYGFTLTLFIQMLTDGNWLKKHVAWSNLGAHFADSIPDIDFSKLKPSTADKEALVGLINDLTNND